ncbi:MAG: hypothetical protein H8D46_03475, partial [FCB group bacterium]|nr:hypothetical protein [FCB group bacterium]
MKFLDIPEPIDEELSRFSTAASVRLRAGWFVQLRWIAILSAFLLAVMAEFILPAMCLKAVLFIIGLLALTNACYILFYFRT